MKQLGWLSSQPTTSPIIKIPLQFMFPPVEALSKELTKLNSTHTHRIIYLGPRWENSIIFHKKYSQNADYKLDQKRVNKNSNFLQDSMSHNQFYRNEIYYRAFQGMNPTLKQKQQLIFESRFESGNLDCVVKVDTNEYDLFLRIDSNTRGHLFWFYFSIKNVGKRKIKFNLCNLTKNSNHFTKGLTPFVYTSSTHQWRQENFTNVTFRRKKLRYNFLYQKLTLRTFYELSFQMEFKDEQEVRFAYCVPYTYSDLQRQLKQLRSVADVGVLGQSLTGVDIPILMVGNQDSEKSKPVVVMTGRVHPGESNGSLILSSLMKHLCFSPEARYLRQKVLTVIIPMTNPDGVIFGNSRTGASGKDLNRQFKYNNTSLFPQIVLLKNLIRKITQTHSIDMYLDFHGHSGKKNMFMFGPSYNITQALYYKCRILPKILANITPVFRYYACTYDIPNDKKTTARAVMLSELNLPIVFTVETSLGFYYDANMGKVLIFDRKKWEGLGVSVVMAIKEYYEDLDQLEEYMDNKKKIKRDKDESGTNVSIMTRKNLKEPKRQEKQKQIKIFKIYEEIKQIEEKKAKDKDKKDDESDVSSDSHNSKEQLQKEKMFEFTDMVTQCIKQEKKRTNCSVQKEIPLKKKLTKKGNKTLKKKDRYQPDEDIFNKFDSELRINGKRQDLKSEVHMRKKYNQKDVKTQTKSEIKRTEVVSHQYKREASFQTKEREKTHNNANVPSCQLTVSQPDIIYIERKSKKLNLRMFNFDKVITDLDSFRQVNMSANKKISRLSPPPSNYDKPHTPYNKMSKVSSHQVAKANVHHSHNISSFAGAMFQKCQQMSLEKMQVAGQSSTNQLKIQERTKFPASYYKIRYQNLKKRKNEEKKSRAFQDQIQYIRITEVNKHGRRDKQQDPFAHFKEERKQSRTSVEIDQEQKGGYAIIKQFPMLG